MWFEASYEPTGLFSLKDSSATNSAAKSLFAPSPYCIKMALLNAILTFETKEAGEKQFETIKNLDIRVALPRYFCVNKCFVKIQKEPHSETKKKNVKLAFSPTVAFREYIYFSGAIRLAFRLPDHDDDQNKIMNLLKKYLPKINYFGKRSCFFQFMGFSPTALELSSCYSTPILDVKFTNNSSKTLQCVDDFLTKSKFENANIYSNNSAGREKKFIFHNCRMIKSNRNFTIYSTVDSSIDPRS